MAPFFAVTLFTSAALLFWVQPMVAKMLLPLLGGSPAVWNTCMVFFQATLLAGYAYAHLLTTRVGARSQRLIHLALMLVALAALPVGLSAGAAPWNFNPFLWLLRALFSTVALPFFVVSSSAPLLQRWFSQARHRSSEDPYFLYAASNLGSITGLLAYPVLIEPGFRLQDQTRLWAALYLLLVLLFVGCALMTGKGPDTAAGPIPAAKPPSHEPSRGARTALSARIHPDDLADLSVRAPSPETASDRIDWGRRLRWMFCAFIPSSLMLGVTTYLTTDIASVPLLWIVPLAIYLLTFVLVFNRSRLTPMPWLARVLPVSAVVLVFVMLAKSDELAWLQIGVNLLFFFCAAMVWHGRLAGDRPSSRHLTEFYFFVSAGGVLGGLFNALIAPACFHTVVEYPLMIAVACLGWPIEKKRTSAPGGAGRGLLWPSAVGVLTAGLAVTVPRLGLEPHLRTMMVFGVPVLLCYLLSKNREQPFSFALGLGAVLAGSQFYTATSGSTLHTERNFFGTLRVTLDPEGRIHELYHGTTVHGMQFTAPERQSEPLAYYHRAGPCGQAMNGFNSRPGGTHVAIIGLGTGAMAAYAKPGQHWTFYEIDPAVLRLAREGRYFTYLALCTNAVIDFKLGDARLRLHEASAKQFDLIVCDAFGSDAPPLHLLNREAMELYLSKLSDHGMLLFHISSRFLDFRPVLGNLAWHFQLKAFVGSEEELSEAMLREGKLPSTWVALARQPADLDPLWNDPRWHALPPAPSMRLWTDDYSNILGIFQWQ
jgi:hypothetical protein